MKLSSYLYIIALLICVSSASFAQTTIFGQLNGNPVNTTGWNLTGAAEVNNDEIILTPNLFNESGTIYYDRAVNLGLCPQFTVEFEFRMWEGGKADGLAFCFLDQAPSGFVVGNVLGIPPTAAGLKVAFDTYDNGCNGPSGANQALMPSIQILNGPNGYDECDPAMVRRNNSSGDLNFMRQNPYQKAKIIYNNGNVEVWLVRPWSWGGPPAGPALYLSTTITPITYAGYFGFSASTGGISDKQSIKNVKIYSNAVPSNAGIDFSTCPGNANIIGTTSNAAYTYAWSPASGLNQTNISNPTATTQNATGVPITKDYVVTTYGTDPTCLTKDTIQITTNPVFNTIVNASMCIGDSYVLAGQTFTTAGTHTVALQSQFNCDSILTLNLAAIPAPNSTLNKKICNGDSFLFNGQNYTSTGTYFSTFPMPLGCDSVATLNLTVLAPILPWTDIVTICQGDSYTFGGSVYAVTGNYPNTFTTTDGCDSLVTLELTVVPSFTSTFNPQICQGDSYVFDGQTYTTTGTHVATFQSVTGCDSLVTMNLTVKPTFASVLNESICQGSTFPFNNQTYASAGTYVANLLSVSGCDSLVTLNLTVGSAITNTVNKTICKGNFYPFNNQNLNTTGTYNGTFNSVGGCDSLVTLNLTVNPAITNTINQTICQGAVYNFNSQTLNASGMYTGTFQNSAGCDSVVTLNLLVIPMFATNLNESICQGASYQFNGMPHSTSGTYVANLLSIAGCDSIVTLNLVVNPIPTMPNVVSNSPLTCPGEEFAMQVVNPATTGTYLWTGPDSYTAQGSTVSFTTKESSVGMYATILQQNGCNSAAATTVLMITGATVTNFEFPNVITPNGDMVNDYLDIDQFFNVCTDYDLIIWNRWGNMIYTQKFGEKPFSGYDQIGMKLTPGVYFYKLTYEGAERHGSISVMY